MKIYHSLKITDALANRLTSFAWALSLLAPFLFIANATACRFLFHILLFFEGWLAWTFNEYYMHRFIMHDGNQKKGLGRILNHSHHHKDPADIVVSNRHRVIMIIGSMALMAFSVLFDDYFTLICGYVFGFTFYSCMHIILHMKWSEKLFPQLHEFHIHHHCKHPDKCFGVTFSWWDHLFGTIPRKDTIITDRVKNFYYKNKSIPGKNLSKPQIAEVVREMKRNLLNH